MSEQNTMCPLKFLAETFGGKWKMPIICILADSSSKRYSVIKRRLGSVTNTMLAQSLRDLEAAGIVSRTQYNEIPPHVEYSLTEKGKRSLPMLTAAADWAVHEIAEAGLSPYCTECQTSR